MLPLTASAFRRCMKLFQIRTWPPRMFWACSGSSVQVLWGFTGSAMRAMGNESDLCLMSTRSPFSSMLPELLSTPAPHTRSNQNSMGENREHCLRSTKSPLLFVLPEVISTPAYGIHPNILANHREEHDAGVAGDVANTTAAATSCKRGA